jgi:diguanylate cyclase (GGDEF)-like protein
VSNYVAMFSDVAVKREHMRHLEHIAHHDALTSLPNRMLLVDRLKQAIAQSQRQQRQLAVVYLDLDGFKAVNDQHGHAVGDELLIAVSSRMKTALRESDTLARLGGDEFVAVLTGLEHAQDCEPVLDRLLRAASDPVNVGTAVLHVSASVGVTLYPQDGADADLLLRQADQAMYQAKQAGKNRYHLFDVNQDVAIRTQRESLDQIQAALERREFVLYYQPKVNMKTGQVIGAEALIRWQHPQQGLLPPSAFLPVIDGHPLCVELGEWVLDTALKQISAWRAMGLDIPVSVNIAGRQLQQADFVSRLSSLLAAHPDVKPAQLELEILETSALEDVAQVSHAMHACRALGVQFSLDDFGTGYSSLTYLKRLPAGTLKIDQSFVRDMLSDPDDLAIVEAIVGLAGAFRSQVIAEGVETVAHGEMLLLLGCDLAQGYGIARPMPASDMPAWVASWRPDPSWTAWLTRTKNAADLTFAFADVEHREWLRAVERFLSGDQLVAPPMDVESCHLGQWLKAEGREQYGQSADFQTLLSLHERLHALGQDLMLAHSQRIEHDAGARLSELRTLHNELIARLRTLLSHAQPH